MKKLFTPLALLVFGAGLAQAQPVINGQNTRVQTAAPNANLSDAKIATNLNIVDVQTQIDKIREQLKDLQKQNTGLAKQNTDLTKQNLDLAKRVTDLETKQLKNEGAINFGISALDKNASALKTQFEALSKQFAEHYHVAGYEYETLDFLMNTGDSNKTNFYIPYVWLGSKGANRPKYDKINDVKPYLGNTSKPQPAPK